MPRYVSPGPNVVEAAFLHRFSKRFFPCLIFQSCLDGGLVRAVDLTCQRNGAGNGCETRRDVSFECSTFRRACTQVNGGEGTTAN